MSKDSLRQVNHITKSIKQRLEKKGYKVRISGINLRMNGTHHVEGNLILADEEKIAEVIKRSRFPEPEKNGVFVKKSFSPKKPVKCWEIAKNVAEINKVNLLNF